MQILDIIDEKWRRRWEELGIFKVDPNRDKKKYFVTVAYPYPNSPQRRTWKNLYTCRYSRTLYENEGIQCIISYRFHYTGTPILAMSKRVATGDRDLIETFMKIHHVSADDIGRFVEPIEIARFFHNEIKQGMIEMGYSIDWRREFTTIDNAYSRFISWQLKRSEERTNHSRFVSGCMVSKRSKCC